MGLTALTGESNYRKRAQLPEIASAISDLGIDNYKGSYQQNIAIEKYLKSRRAPSTQNEPTGGLPRMMDNLSQVQNTVPKIVSAKNQWTADGPTPGDPSLWRSNPPPPVAENDGMKDSDGWGQIAAEQKNVFNRYAGNGGLDITIPSPQLPSALTAWQPSYSNDYDNPEDAGRRYDANSRDAVDILNTSSFTALTPEQRRYMQNVMPIHSYENDYELEDTDPVTKAFNQYHHFEEPADDKLKGQLVARYGKERGERQYWDWQNRNIKGEPELVKDWLYYKEKVAKTPAGAAYCSTGLFYMLNEAEKHGLDPKHVAAYNLIRSNGAWQVHGLAKKYPELFDISETPKPQSIGVHSPQNGFGHAWWVNDAQEYDQGKYKVDEYHWNSVGQGPNKEHREGVSRSRGNFTGQDPKMKVRYVKLKDNINWDAILKLPKYAAFRASFFPELAQTR
jgi:hypothetical protein